MIAVSVIGCVVAFFLNRKFAEKYGKPAIQWGAFALQVIAAGGVLANLPEDGLSRRFLFWLAALAAAYAFGLWECRKHAAKQQAAPGDIIRAMTVQAMLPVCAAPVLLMITGIIVFDFLWAH